MTTIQPITAAAPSRSVLRSVAAVAGAFVSIAILTTAVDQVFHSLGVFPPWGQVTYEPGPYVLAIAYRTILGILGGYLAARWAPLSPLKHAGWLGIIGVVVSAAGGALAVAHNLGPAWYAIALVVLAFPSTWAGGVLYA